MERASIPLMGLVAGNTLTNAYQNLIVATGSVREVFICSDAAQAILISFDGGATDNMYIPIGGVIPQLRTLDFGSKDLQFSGTIMVKHAGVVPASGFIGATIIKTA